MSIQTVKINLSGMTCGNCARSVEKTLAATPGVTNVKVDLESARATAEYDAELVTPEVLVNAVRDLGYGAKA